MPDQQHVLINGLATTFTRASSKRHCQSVNTARMPLARFVFGSTPEIKKVSNAIAPAKAVSCNPALLELAAARCALLLQGPVGPFFDRLTQWLQSNGTSVHRVILQAGDRHDSQLGEPMAYVGTAAQWPTFVENTVRLLGVDLIVLFGQTRSHHMAAIALAEPLGIPVVVLEEGYVRPGFITMELGGVNGFSTTLRDFEWQPELPGPTVQTRKPASTEHQFRQMVWFACRHYWALYWGRKISAHYQHHRSTSIWNHGYYWACSLIKKSLHLIRDGKRVKLLQDQSYFFVPLQHDGDSQITHHSPYVQNTEFIIEVLRSFAHHAPTDTRLVFRQHPHSRGGRSHDRLIRSLARELGIGPRVEHLVEGHTPTIITHARGVVVINSTVGLQALMRNKPLMVLGEAMDALPDGGEHDVEVEMTHVTADIIFRTIFSVPMEGVDARRIFEAFARFQAVAPRLLLPSIYGLRWLVWPWDAWRSRQAAREIRGLLEALIRPRFDAHQAGEPAQAADILQSFMEATDPQHGGGFSFDELVDQVAMLFLAGHETSASALTWACHLLANAPEVQERAHAEVVQQLGERLPELSEMKAMNLTRNVFRETLRLFPPVGFMARQAASACTLRKKAVRQGATVVVAPWLIQRHHDLWQEPDAFNPDRYDNDASRESLRQGYLPFGMGPRVCMGAAFALQEATLILACLLRRYRLSAVKGHEPQPVGRLTIRSANGVRLQLHRRGGAS